jgi:tRNA (guanine26-N2/guanine27-N2)-dimethyltransferase
MQNALRILLFTISSAASRHCKYIEPLLSLQTDFYVRVFVRVRSGKKECGLSTTKIGNLHNC